MPLIRKIASDVTTYRRVNATSLPVSTIKSAAYIAPLRNLLGPIARASDAAEGASPSNTVLKVYGDVPPPPPPPTDTAGALQFTSSVTPTYIAVNKKASLFPGTGPFTISFYMYLDSSTPGAGININPYVFALSQTLYPGYQLTLSFPGDNTSRSYSLIMNNSAIITAAYTPYMDSWHFINIVGSSGEIKLEIDGTNEGTYTGAYNIADTGEADLALNIGTFPQDASPGQVSFTGYIANFRWVVGQAIYTTSTPNPPLPIIPGNTSLFLRADTDATKLVDSGTDSGNTVLAVSGPGTIPWSSQVVV